MKKAMQISIGGLHFHIDEDAYNLLKEYTDSLREFFSKDGEASTEIIDDIEQRMAELLNEKISDSKQVLTFEDVKNVIDTLGKIEEFEFERTTNENATGEEEPGGNRKVNKSLFRDPDNSILGGVCSGLAAYFNIEPWIMRVIFIVLLFINIMIPPFLTFSGFGILLYIILWIVVPKARTTAQKLQMRGEPVTVENIKRTVNDEYQKVKSSVKNIGQSDGFKKGVGVLEEFFRMIGKIILAVLKVMVYIIGFFFLIAGLILLAGFGTLFFARHQWLQHLDWPQIYLPDLSDFFTDPTTMVIVGICLLILIAIPVISLIIWGIKLLTNVRGSNRILQASAVTIWVIALIVLIAIAFTESNAFAFQASSSDNEIIKPSKSSTLYLEVKDANGVMDGVTVYSIFDYDIYYDKNDEKILGKPKLRISESKNNNIELIINKKMRNISMKNADEYLEEIEYNWKLRDSVLIFDNYFSLDEENKWRFAEVELVLEIPENQKIYISKNMDRILQSYWLSESVGSWDAYDKTLIMSDQGLKFVNQ